MEIKTNKNRLWESIMHMAKIGPGLRGGNCRLALTESDIEGKNMSSRGAVIVSTVVTTVAFWNITTLL